MYKLNKKGEISSEPLKIVMYLVIAVFILSSFIFIGNKLINSLSESRREAQCSNSEQWQKIESVLRNLESGDTSESMLFYNGECKLASFTVSQQFQNYKVKPSHNIGKKPELCLCKIEDETCKAYDCYKLSKFNEITGSNNIQFTTLNSPDYTSLSFKAEGITLKISGELEKTPDPLSYKYLQQYSPFDTTHLVDEMLVQFKTNNIKSFAPVVSIKEKKDMINTEQIPDAFKYFNIDLVDLPYNVDIINYRLNPSVIDLNLIETSFIILRFDKQEFDPLFKEGKQLNLYYLKDNSWQPEPMICELISENYMCGVRLKYFSKNFAIGKREVESSFDILKYADKNLLEYIDEESKIYGVNTNLVKSIIQVESNWDSEAVSPCGAGGIAQFIRQTAIDSGLKVPNYGTSESPECKNKITQNCRRDQKNLCKMQQNQDGTYDDERFDPKKAILASIKHIKIIEETLRKNSIEPTPAFLSAAYNQGENAVIKCNCIPEGEAENYVAKVIEVYKKLSEQQLASAQGEKPT